MKFGVLGPLTVDLDTATNSADSEQTTNQLPSAPKTRQLLALLVLNEGSLVTLDTCVQELWGEDAPRSAVQSLHTRVFQIRQALAALPEIGTPEAAKRVLETHHQGYILNLSTGCLDVHALDGRLAQARGARAGDDALEISRALRGALRLWRGATLADVETGMHLQAHVTRLEGIRMTALEQCLDAELRLGMHHQLISELGDLVIRFPTHENLHAQYMLALYRSGRTAQALDVYQDLNRRLVEELGIEPSHKLRSLQTAVLAEDRTLDVTPPRNLRLSLDLAVVR
ncbi:BTAD domain-containing putative transcriptional regulator [Streptomyces griseorubiginosus]|uniref:AfsR/SARP family transcriptional regulator n=1 Tax=Streptomyces griseorubiginosus TaxID=67304 RepID=UPI0036E95C63